MQSQRTSTKLEIPVPPGMQLYPYQEAGVAFLYGKPNVLLADDMGLGKTIQAIALINVAMDIRNVLVICQLIKVEDWAYEFRQWLTRPMAIEEAGSAKRPKLRGGITILNYEAAVKWQQQLTRPWDLVIVDESHHIKNATAKRTKAILAILRHARRKVFLTGTPILNRPYELWTTLSALDPDRWRSFRYFYGRYCNYDQRGHAHLAELNQILRSTIMLRRLKEDVLPDLPPKTRIIHRVQPTTSARQLMDAFNADDVSSLVDRALAASGQQDFAEVIAKEGKTVIEQLAEIARMRHELALEKVPFVVEYISAILENTEKVVVFTHHRDVAEQIAARFGEAAAVVHGEVPLQERNARIAAFREQDSVRVFIGTLATASTGLNLQVAHHAVFAETDWVPAILTQAEDRLARIGQKSNVTVHHIVFAGTLDDLIIKRIVEKQEIAARAIDGVLIDTSAT